MAAAAVALACAGCTTTGQPVMKASLGGTPTVAFESIEGLPEAQFRRLVQALSDEADARQLAVVSRTGAAQYRVRGYAATHIRGKRTSVAWAWDIYDANQQRALRISGEQRPAVRQKGWAAVDDRTLREMARSGMRELAAFLAAPDAPAQPAAPEKPSNTGPAIAAGDDPSPETAGQLADAAPPAENTVASRTSGEPVPVPRSRPRLAGLATHAMLAPDLAR
jgi:hypothetical protein